MSSIKEQDLQYVRQVILDAEKHDYYPVIYFLWAAILFSGFLLNDFYPSAIPTFWIIATPLGFLASMWLGYKQDMQRGQSNSAIGIRWSTHFGISILFAFLAAFTQPSSMMLIWALSYSLAGVHLDRYLLPIGLICTLTYLAVKYEIITSNLLLGSIIAASLVLTGLVQLRVLRREKV